MPAISAIHEVIWKMWRVLVCRIIGRQIAQPVHLIGEVISNTANLSAFAGYLLIYRAVVGELRVVKEIWQIATFQYRVYIQFWQSGKHHRIIGA